MNPKGNTTNQYAGPIIAVILLLLVIFIGVNMGGLLFTLLINSIIGIGLLVILNFLPFIEVKINIWTVLIVAFGGILGVVILVILDLIGIDV